MKKIKNKKALKIELFLFFFFIFRAFFFFSFLNIFRAFFLISPETVKLVIGKPTVCIKSLNILPFY